MTWQAPAEVWPLAYYLAEEMEARGWRAVDVAARMPGKDPGKNIALINLVLAVQSDAMIIDDDLMTALAAAFEVSPAFFRSLHENWLNWPDARQPFNCPDRLLNGLIFPDNDNAQR